MSADLLSFVMPRAYAPAIASVATVTRSVDPTAVRFFPASHDAFLGIPLLAVLVAFLVAWRRSRVAWVLGTMFGLLVLGSLGPVLLVNRATVGSLPWSFLWRLPVIRFASPVRLMAYGFLVLSLVVALWLSSGTWRLVKWGAVVVSVAVMVALGFPRVNHERPVPVPSLFTTDTYRRYLAPGETVLLLPNRANSGMLWQSETGMAFRMVGGFVSFLMPPRSGLPSSVVAMNQLNPGPAQRRAFRSFLKQAGVRAILLDAGDPEHWASGLASLGLRPTQVGGVSLYRVPARA